MSIQPLTEQEAIDLVQKAVKRANEEWAKIVKEEQRVTEWVERTGNSA